MNIDLTKYRVVYESRVLKALVLQSVCFSENDYPALGKTVKPEMIEILIVDDDGTLSAVSDESWKFQFIPILEKP